MLLLGRVAALCLLAVVPLAGPTAAAYVLDRADPEATAMVRLFEHALHNDRAWRLVLDQMVLVSAASRPAYTGHCEPGDYECEGRGDHVHDAEARELVRLLDPGAEHVTAGTVLRRVVDRFAWLGSHVRYAAHVLGTALTCVTYTIVSVQLDLLTMRDDAAAAAAAAATAAPDESASDPPAATSEPAASAADAGTEDQWALLAVFADKVAAVRGDLRQLAVLSVLLTEFADPLSPYRRHRAYLLRLIRAQIDAAVDRNCVRAPPDEVLGWFGVHATHQHLEKDVANKDPRCAVRAYDQVTAAAADLYDGLLVAAADLGAWKETLDYGAAVSGGVNFYMRFEEALRDDEVGRTILTEKWRWPLDRVALSGSQPGNLVGGPQEQDVISIPIA